MKSSRATIFHRLHDYFFPHRRNNYRPHVFSWVSVAAIAVVLIVLEAGYVFQLKVVLPRTDFLAAVLPGVLADLTNESRLSAGVSAVTHDPLLDAAAQAAATDMATKGYFAHVSPDGTEPWHWLDLVGYRYQYAGENLAVNFTDSKEVQTAWLESPTHRANIMKPQYTEVGFGTATGVYEGKETTFVVEFLAAPAISEPGPVVAKSRPAAQAAPALAARQPAVLGLAADDAAAAPLPAAPPAAPWLASILASPLSAMLAIATILFLAIAFLFSIALLVGHRFKLHHPSVIMGGAMLLALFSGSMVLSTTLAGAVSVTEQASSVH